MTIRKYKKTPRKYKIASFRKLTSTITKSIIIKTTKLIIILIATPALISIAITKRTFRANSNASAATITLYNKIVSLYGKRTFN